MTCLSSTPPGIAWLMPLCCLLRIVFIYYWMQEDGHTFFFFQSGELDKLIRLGSTPLKFVCDISSICLFYVVFIYLFIYYRMQEDGHETVCVCREENK